MGREESLWSMASVRDRERGFMAELEHRFIARESVFWKVGYVRVAHHQLNNGKEFGEHNIRACISVEQANLRICHIEIE